MSENLPDRLFLIEKSDAPEGPQATTLDFDRTPTVLLTFAANRFTRLSSRHYQAKFGLGAMDWRMLVMLSREPGSSVSHAARTIGIDKAAVSRSLQRLEQDGYVRAEQPSPDERRKDWVLTPAGAALHDQILQEALRRQRILLDGFSEADVTAFTAYLRRFLANLETLSEIE